jgi:hypothetical protein
MENSKPNSAGIAFKWSLIGIITSIVLTYVYQYSGISYTSPIRYISYIPFIAFMFFAQIEYRKLLGGFASFGEEFVAGLLYSVFSGIFLGIFLYVYFGFLSPQVYQEVLDTQRTAMEAKGASSDQIDQSLDFMSKHGAIITGVIVIFATAFVGGIIALIGAAIFNKKRTLQDIENESRDAVV